MATTNLMSILSIVFAFVFPLAGLILGIVALNQIKTSGEEGRILAIIGIVLSIIFMLGWILVLLGWILAIGAITTMTV